MMSLAPALAQVYPSRAIKLIVPFPAGGANDTIARLLAQRLSSSLNQPVVVENQAGAGGTIGTRAVAHSIPDGYTLLMAAVSTVCIASLLYRLDYDPTKAFAPVALLASDALALVASPSVPASTLLELINYAKANPGKLNYGSANGIAPHIMMELFKIRSGRRSNSADYQQQINPASSHRVGIAQGTRGDQRRAVVGAPERSNTTGAWFRRYSNRDLVRNCSPCTDAGSRD
jgi:tripartite-type tricarboxylate transporter receptor subunit TctC